MNNLFICGTSYQLFNICNIIKRKYSKDNNYLLVVGISSHAKEKVYTLAKDKCDEFRKVFFLNIPFNELKVKNKIIRGIKYVIYIIKAILYRINNIKFDRCFHTGVGPFSTLLAYKYISKKKIETYFIEDGMGSYVYALKEELNFENFIHQLFKNILEKIYKCSALDNVKGSFLYEPAYVMENKRNIPLIPIGKLKVNSEESKEIYEKFSESKNSTIIEGKCIFFDSPLNSEKDLKINKEVLKNIKKYINKKVLIKKHPSALNKEYKDFEMFETQDNFEIYNLINSVENTIIISMLSTAAFTPKMIFNEEPTIILLYKLFENKVSEEFDLIVKKMKQDYTKNNIFVPNTMDELINICKIIGQDN